MGQSNEALLRHYEPGGLLERILAGDPREDACTGYKTKNRGNVGCYEIEPGTKYFCSFAVNLERNAVDAGLGGCI